MWTWMQVEQTRKAYGNANEQLYANMHLHVYDMDNFLEQPE